MKVNELFEATAQTTPEQILKGLKGIKGVTVSEPIKMVVLDKGDVEAWKVMVSYKAKRGVPGRDRIEVYKTEDGDWGYQTESENKEQGDLTDLLAELRDYLTVAAKFHARGSAIEEEALTESLGDDMLRAAKQLKREGSLKSYHRQMIKYLEHMIDAYEWNMKRHGRLSTEGQSFLRQIKKWERELDTHKNALKTAQDTVKEERLTEGYERKVLAVLRDAGIDAYFEKGTLMLQTKDDWKKATKALKDADDILKLPSMEYLSAGI